MNLLTFIFRGLQLHQKNQTRKEEKYKSKQLLATPPTVPSENAPIQISDFLRQIIEQVVCATRAADVERERERVPNSEIGGSIVDDYWDGGREAMVIKLSLDLRKEWHLL